MVLPCHCSDMSAARSQTDMGTMHVGEGGIGSLGRASHPNRWTCSSLKHTQGTRMGSFDLTLQSPYSAIGLELMLVRANRGKLNNSRPALRILQTWGCHLRMGITNWHPYRPHKLLLGLMCTVAQAEAAAAKPAGLSRDHQAFVCPLRTVRYALLSSAHVLGRACDSKHVYGAVYSSESCTCTVLAATINCRWKADTCHRIGYTVCSARSYSLSCQTRFGKAACVKTSSSPTGGPGCLHP